MNFLYNVLMSRFHFFFLLFIFPIVVFARDIEVYVEDEDMQIPLEGARITLRNGLQFSSDRNGTAKVILPDDRQTIITITYPGYETLRLTIPAANAYTGASTERFTAIMRLGGIMHGQELVLEAARPETSETRSGRSVGISDRDLERTAEIGIIEDVMNSVKLLPGVGYSGMFSATPSIRGGDPGDLMAVFDGFYLERPYHWMGSISIFDPKMVSGARLSHGVFSARYGHTISGLLEVTSKSPSSTETEVEAAIGSSTASGNLSLPFSGRGGLLFIGKLTYWDTLIWAAQGLSKVVEDENLDMVNYITTSPYIRSASISANYRITPDVEWRLNTFFGSDGIGMDFITDYGLFNDDGIEGKMELFADYNNYQGFLISGISASPNPMLAIRLSGGIGFIHMPTNELVNSEIIVPYNDSFLDSLVPYIPPYLSFFINNLRGQSYSAPNINAGLEVTNSIFNAQGRLDVDIDIGHGFIAAVGVQELYSRWNLKQDITLSSLEIRVTEATLPMFIEQLPSEYGIFLPFLTSIPNLAVVMPRSYSSDIVNQGFTTSAYGLVEYTSPNQRIGVELGLRVDHLYFIGSEVSFQTLPALNPRLNIDFGLLKNYKDIESLTMTLGTGLFSSINSLLSFMEENMVIVGDVKFNRAWTSVVGYKIDFLQKYSFNIEGYHKYIFDRAYITADITASNFAPTFNFDGTGKVWGFDLQLQRMNSRYWDGWISYTFTWAKYLDPNGGGEGLNMGGIELEENWYWPSFHRFHNCNLVLSIKPLEWINIGIRFGFASGQPRNKVSNEIESYPVIYINENDEMILVQKYRRKQLPPEEKGIERAAWSFPLDVKVSFFTANKSGKAGLEIYVAAENLSSLLYSPTTDRTTFNSYTGKEDTGGSAANFDLPIPMLSFGFKWRY